MGIDTTFFPTTHFQNEGDKKAHTFVDAVDQVKANQRAVKLLDMMFPEAQADTKIALGKARNQFKSVAELEAALKNYVQKNISVQRDPSRPLSDIDFEYAAQFKKDQYIREAVVGIVHALKPLYEQFGDTSQLNKETLPGGAKERAAVRASFMRFLDTHVHEIRTELAKGTSLEWVIYSKFYAQGDSELQIKEGSHQEKIIRERYSYILQQENRDIEAVSKQFAVSIVDRGYWKHALIRTHLSSQKLGRIYLNVHPLDTPHVFKKAVELLAKNNISSQAKIPIEMDADGVNRADKMVIYFLDQDDARIMKILEQLYIENSQSFLKGSPRFSAGLTDRSGAVLTGISFGEDPFGKDKSFGMVRSAILANVLQVAHKAGKRIDDPGFPYDSYFQQVCLENNVDANNMAFNEPGVSGTFSEIRRRIKK